MKSKCFVVCSYVRCNEMTLMLFMVIVNQIYSFCQYQLHQNLENSNQQKALICHMFSNRCNTRKICVTCKIPTKICEPYKIPNKVCQSIKIHIKADKRPTNIWKTPNLSNIQLCCSITKSVKVPTKIYVITSKQNLLA